MTFKIDSIKLKFSANKHSESGWIASIELKGVMPGCRKSGSISCSPMAGYIWLRSLYGSGTAMISPDGWMEMISRAEPISDDIFPIDITSDMIESARSELGQPYIDTAARLLKEAHEWNRQYNRPLFVPAFDSIDFGSIA